VSNESVYDYCIVGAGTIGSYIAEKLILKMPNSRICIVESDDVEKVRVCTSSKSNYSGLKVGRAFGFGGTSRLWGGQMISMVEDDFLSRVGGRIHAWPLNFSELNSYYYIVIKKIFGFKYSEELIRKLAPKYNYLNELDLICRTSIWIPSKKRNIWKQYGKNICKNSKIINNFAEQLKFEKNGTSKYCLVTCDKQQNRTNISAKKFILCLGAAETEALIKRSKDLDNIKTFSICDHISFIAGKLDIIDYQKFHDLFASEFFRGLVISKKFELNNKPELNILPKFNFKFIAQKNNDPFFSTVKILLDFLQGKSKSLPKIKLNQIFYISYCGLILLFYKYFYKRLWLPKSIDYYLTIDIEQMPDVSNKIYEKNGKLTLNWSLMPDDLNSLDRIKTLVKEYINLNFSNIIKINDTKTNDANFYDVYHPFNNLRMGRDPKNSSVDINLNLWNKKEIYVCSTGVFPSLGSANPGLTNFALAERLVEHLVFLESEK